MVPGAVSPHAGPLPEVRHGAVDLPAEIVRVILGGRHRLLCIFMNISGIFRGCSPEVRHGAVDLPRQPRVAAVRSKRLSGAPIVGAPSL